jgi:hypothetical protein
LFWALNLSFEERILRRFIPEEVIVMDGMKKKRPLWNSREKFTMSLLFNGFLFLLTSNPGLIAQEASTVKIIQVDGIVDIKKAETDEWSVAREGETFSRGDTIHCKENSATVLKWSNGSIVKVYPDTTISLGGVTFELDKKMEKTILHLEKGRIFAKGQIAEHIFCHFEVKMGTLFVLTQGAEFALKYDDTEMSFSVYSLIGRTITEIGTERIRVEEGNQGTFKVGQKLDNDSIRPLSDKIKETLTNTSKELGGSLLIEEEIGGTGGKITAKIGGVRNRRGSAPYEVRFQARIQGGSGKIKSIKWDFGDGETAEGKEVEHTFTQGLYVIILRVEDENGEKSSAQINISAEEDCAC